MNRQQQLCVALNNQQSPSPAIFLKHVQNNPRCHSCVEVAGLQVWIFKETKKKKNPPANFFSPLAWEALASSAARCDAAFRASAEEFLPRHAARLLRVQIAGVSNNIASSSTFFPTSLWLHRTPQNVHQICCERLTGGISHSPLSVVQGVGWNTEFFTCRWFSVISIFQPKSQTSSLEKNDNCWQNPWHAVSSNANLG